MPNLDGYYFFRQDRNEAGTGGGVCIYVHEDVLATAVDIPNLTSRDIEQIWCVVHRGSDKILLGCIYRPPNSSLPDHQHTTRRITQTLEHAQRAVKTLGCSSLYVYGDFNFPHLRYEAVDVDGGTATLCHVAHDTTGDKRSDTLFMEALEDSHLQQLVTEPTFQVRSTATPTNTLDLVITDDPSRVFALETDAPLGSTPNGCAHFVVKWHISMARSDHQPSRRPRYIWSRADWEAVSRDTASINWEARIAGFASVDDAYNDYLEQYTAICDEHIPKTCAPIRPTSAPWMNDEVRAAIEEKRLLHGRLRATGKQHKETMRSACRAAQKEVDRALARAYEQYEMDLVLGSKEDNGKALHAYARLQQTVPERIHALKDAGGHLFIADKDKCRILNDAFQGVFTVEPPGEMPTFADRTDGEFNPSADELFKEHVVEHLLTELKVDKSKGPDEVYPRVLKECAAAMATPLTLIYRRSHDEGRAPAQFKQANVVPIYKKGSKVSALNYRPISLTSVVCKIQEKIQHRAILRYLMDKELIVPEQHGFLPRKSCTTNLLEAYEILSDAVERGDPVDVIFTDFCKAFDTVPHERLLHKLAAYGISGQLLAWLRDWLTTRQQRVVLGEHKADWKDVLSGVPQGSVLGPLLFVLFINDLRDELHFPMRMYADDTKILGVIKEPADYARVQADIDACSRWAHTWLMGFNLDKCKVMHVGRGAARSTHVYSMTDHTTDETETLQVTHLERDLGVLVSDDLKLAAQCRAAAAKANWKFGIFKKAFVSRSERLWQVLYKTHIRPHLEHAIQAWSPYLRGDIAVLERVQRRVCNHMPSVKFDRTGRRRTYDEQCKHLGWQKLVDRRERGDLIFTYQHLHGNAAVKLDWPWVAPLSSVEGAAAGVRTNDKRLAPPIYNLQQREHFLTSRVAVPLRALPTGIMNAPSVNAFKNRYDSFTNLPPE